MERCCACQWSNSYQALRQEAGSAPITFELAVELLAHLVSALDGQAHLDVPEASLAEVHVTFASVDAIAV